MALSTIRERSRTPAQHLFLSAQHPFLSGGGFFSGCAVSTIHLDDDGKSHQHTNCGCLSRDNTLPRELMIFPTLPQVHPAQPIGTY